MDRSYGAAALEYAPSPVWYESGMPQAPGGHGGAAEKGYLALLAFAVAVAVLLYRAGYPYVGMGVVGVPLLAGWLFEPRIGIYAYCFWQAWDGAVLLGGKGSWLTPAKLLAFGVLGICALYVWRYPLRLHASRRVVWGACLLGALAMLSAVWSYDQFRSLRLGSQMLVQLGMMVLMVVMISHNQDHVKRLAFWTVLGGATAAAYVILFGMAQQTYGRATLSDETNPNTTAAGLTVAMGCILLLWYVSRSHLLKLLLIGAFILMLVAVVQTGSRAALAGILGALGATAVLAGGAGRLKRFVFMLVVLAFAYVIGALVVYSKLVPEKTSVRLAELMMLPGPQGVRYRSEGLTKSRQFVWNLAVEGYKRNPVLGAGIGCSVYGSGEATGYYKDVHSNVLGALVDLGPLGLLVFLGLHLAMVLAILRLKDPRLKVPAWVILLSSFAVGATHTTYTTKWFWLPITFLAIIYELDAQRSADEAQASLYDDAATSWGRPPLGRS